MTINTVEAVCEEVSCGIRVEIQRTLPGDIVEQPLSEITEKLGMLNLLRAVRAFCNQLPRIIHHCLVLPEGAVFQRYPALFDH